MHIFLAMILLANKKETRKPSLVVMTKFGLAAGTGEMKKSSGCENLSFAIKIFVQIQKHDDPLKPGVYPSNFIG